MARESNKKSKKETLYSILIKRVYEKPEKIFGLKVLVDSLWPKGLSREDANIDIWLKEVAPSPKLRKWFDYDPGKWVEFKEKYFEELSKKDIPDKILRAARKSRVVLLYGAKDDKFNNAVALKDYLEKKKASGPNFFQKRLFEFYAVECPPCLTMRPLVDQLEREEGVKIEKYEVWHNKENAKIMEKYAMGKCLGVPFFFNTATEDFICGAVFYDRLKEWALGKTQL